MGSQNTLSVELSLHYCAYLAGVGGICLGCPANLVSLS